MKAAEDEMFGERKYSMCKRKRGAFLKLLAFVFQSFVDAGLIQRAFSSVFRFKREASIPQCSYVEGVPDMGTVIYKQEVNRWSDKSYTFKFHHPDHVITGIACRPKNKETPSPEAEVIEGGVNYNHVMIKLTPVCGGHWSCVIDICGNLPTDACEKFCK